MPAGALSLLDLVALPAEMPGEREARAPAISERDAGRLLATHLYPELQEWLPVLDRLAVSAERAAVVAGKARRNGTGFAAELLVSGLADDEQFYRALAAEAGLRFEPAPDPQRLIVSEQAAAAFLRRRSWHIPVKLVGRDGGTTFLIAPEGLSMDALREKIARYPGVAGNLKITTPRALRSAVLACMRQSLVRAATSDLAERFPDYSARLVLNTWQGMLVGALIVGMPVAFLLASGAAYLSLHVFFSFFFLACVGLRFAAVSSPRWPRRPPDLKLVNSELPVYSVLVALYREAEVVPDLVRALDRIVWPRAKLEIKLVCEEDDRATLDAIAAVELAPNFEVIRVPVYGPRTKPKALAYALPLASGAFVALYDAEDRPHPMQVAEAWHTFRRSPPEVGCVQAPLEISNRDESPVSMMFAFEYAALFRGLLPWLARRRLLVPLGGTSNHFRRAVLDEVGGWDPYNVTEDADLGVRLARLGFRTEMIDCATREDAPADLATWRPQRSRWMKGWLLTWLVHMRHPIRLARDLGPGSFVIAQILFAGMVASALIHPFLLLTGVIVAIDLMTARPFGVWLSSLFVIDVVNIACGYLSFLLLGWQVLERAERMNFWRIVLFTPPYWVMMSVAAWMAVLQLCRDPHLWDKTSHVRQIPPRQASEFPDLHTAGLSRPATL